MCQIFMQSMWLSIWRVWSFGADWGRHFDLWSFLCKWTKTETKVTFHPTPPTIKLLSPSLLYFFSLYSLYTLHQLSFCSILIFLYPLWHRARPWRMPDLVWTFDQKGSYMNKNTISHTKNILNQIILGVLGQNLCESNIFG